MMPSPFFPRPSNSFVRYQRDELEQSIANRFEKTALSHPHRLAVKSRSGQRTYNELNREANRIAWNLLNQRGEIPEPVGLLIEDECRAIAALFGVLKSGRSYVPFAGSTPHDRFAARLQDSQVRVLITDRNRIDSIRKHASDQCKVLAVEDLAEGSSTDNPALTISADAVAAIFYTSGSTGRPKGVIQNQRNVLHRVMLTTNSCGISFDDRLTLLTAPTYSASLRSLFCALLNGASVHPFNVLESGIGELSSWLGREELTTYHSVPTVFRQWMSNLTGAEDFSKLRLIMLGGEAINNRDVELYKKHLSSDCVFLCSLSSNETGPMRNFFINKSTDVGEGPIPVGYEVEDKEILILDENGQESGAGQVGEIAVRSAFLSPGYWRQPELTDAAFRRDPSFPDKTIYYTGDMGILRPDGCLLYRGRKDFRAKIRGIRVEMEEIEAALQSHPSVKEAVVSAREQGQPGNQRLVGYVVPVKDTVLDTVSMRKFLSEKLPDYMVPSAFLFLDSLPRTVNGKINRQALPAPQQTRPDGVTIVPPRDAIEAALTRMWETMLQVRPVSVLDNFFDLGGDSLAASQMITRIEQEFGKTLPPRAVFQSPCIEQLAVALRQDKAPESWSSLVKLQSGKADKTATSGKERMPIFCILYSGGFKDEFFSYASLAPHIGRDFSFYAVLAQGTDGVSQPHQTVEEMAAAYIKDIKTVQPEGPYYVLGECFSAPVAYETARQLRNGHDDAVFLGLLDARMQTHWYYRFLGRKLGARVRDRMTSLNDSRSWNYLTKGLKFHITELGKLKWSDRLEYVSKRADKAMSVSSRAFAKRRVSPPPVETKPNTTPPKSGPRRRASHAYHLAVRAYLLRPYPGRISVIANEEWCNENPTLGWPNSGGLDVYKIPGNHHTYMRGHLPMVAEILRTCIEKFERETERKAATEPDLARRSESLS
jgi:amino acid adenylation domain-containing protein